MDEVEICTASPGKPGDNFHLIRDQATGLWRGPVLTSAQREWMEGEARRLYLNQWIAGGGDENEFAATWPARWEAMQRPTGQLSPQLFAVVDTGLLSEHPLIKGRVEEEADFTGEGPEDGNGHGTMVALVMVPILRDIPRYANVKVIKANGRGSPGQLLAGLGWLLAYRRSHPDVPLVVTLSVGIRRDRASGRCEGDCEICRAAIALAEAGAVISAAAGNWAGETTCPAVAGLLGRHPGIMAVGRLDEKTSGQGSVMAPTGPQFGLMVPQDPGTSTQAGG